MKTIINRQKLKKWLRIINPPPQIGGLEVSDSALRYVAYGSDGRLQQVSLRLPVGLVSEGRITHKANFVAALAQLRQQINPRKNLNVIVSISAVNVYSQIFNLPLVARGKLQEAAELNLKIISPINVQAAYYDWQLVGESSGNKLDLLGVFVSRDVVDDLTTCLERARITTVAIEPAPISLARVINHLGQRDINKPQLAISLSADGLDFFILKGGNLYFNYFVSWQKGGGDLAAIKKAISVELQRILNFYTSRWGGLIEELILVGAVNKELAADISKEFKLKISDLSLAGYGQLAANWAVALGAALRGLVPRSKDIIVSLAQVGTEIKFAQNRLDEFVGFWRNMTVAALLVATLVFGVFDFILTRSLASINQKTQSVPDGFSKDEVQQLKNEAQAFNLLVDKALAAQTASSAWSPLFYLLQNLAGGNVVINQIQIQREALSVVISGSGTNERAAVDFKEKLAKQTGFKDVALPLTNIKMDDTGRATFTATFKLERWPL